MERAGLIPDLEGSSTTGQICLCWGKDDRSQGGGYVLLYAMWGNAGPLSELKGTQGLRVGNGEGG